MVIVPDCEPGFIVVPVLTAVDYPFRILYVVCHISVLGIIVASNVQCSRIVGMVRHHDSGHCPGHGTGSVNGLDNWNEPLCNVPNSGSGRPVRLVSRNGLLGDSLMVQNRM